MAEQFTATDTNNAANFNSRINEISGLNTGNKTQLETLIADATAHLGKLDNQITVANSYISTLQTLLSNQAAALTLNQSTRSKMTDIETQIPQRLSQYPSLSTNATNLENNASQYVIGTSVMAASPVLSELVTLGKTGGAGKLIGVNPATGNLIFVDPPSGSDRMATGCYQNQQPTGTGGGAGTANAWTERTLNTTVKSEAGMILDTGRLALPAGSYVLWGFVTCCQCGRFKSQLVNRSTNGTFKGSNVASSISGDDFNGFSYVEAAFTLTATNFFSFDTMVEYTHPNPQYTNGAPVNVAGAPEVYASLVVLKLS